MITGALKPAEILAWAILIASLAIGVCMTVFAPV
jgi:hypothetical protein